MLESRGLLSRLAERPLAIAWKELLVLGRGARTLRDIVGAVIFFLPILVFAGVMVAKPGEHRFAGHLAMPVVAAMLSTLSFALAWPAATSLALERERDTLSSLVVSPAMPRDLVLGKLAALLGNAVALKSIAFPALAAAYVLGGREAGFIPRYFLVLLSVDLSFASFALMLGSRPLKPPSTQLLAKTGMSQAGLALQRSVGFAVLTSLVPIYVTMSLIPIALQHGLVMDRSLEPVGAVGIFHPLLTLVVWGDLPIFGRAVPIWIVACLFHLFLSLPFLASAAEALRPPGAPRGRAVRASFLLLMIFVLGLATGTLARTPLELRGLVASGLAIALVVGAAMRASSAPLPRRPFGRAEVLLSLLSPRRAFSSAAESAPGFALVLSLAALPFLLLVLGSEMALRTWGGLALASLGIAAIGARLAARAQSKEALALEGAIERRPVPEKAEARSEGEESQNEPRSGAATVFGAAALLLIILPLGCAFGLGAAQTVPALASIAPVLKIVAIGSLALNPLTALLPVLQGSAIGAPLGTLFTSYLGVDPSYLFGLHVALWALVLAIAIGTLRRAKEVRLPAK